MEGICDKIIQETIYTGACYKNNNNIIREHTDIIWEEFMSTSHFKDQLVFECSAESAWEKYYTIHADKNN